MLQLPAQHWQDQDPGVEQRRYQERTPHGYPHLPAVTGQRWYERLLAQVNPRLVIPQHWDDFFQLLEKAVKPFWDTSRWKIPPLGRINLKIFKIRSSLPIPIPMFCCRKYLNPITLKAIS